VQDGRLPGGLLQGPSYVLHHVPGILLEHGIVFHDQEALVVLLQDGHKLEECVGGRISSSVIFRFIRQEMRPQMFSIL